MREKAAGSLAGATAYEAPQSDAVGAAYGLSPWAVASDGAVYGIPRRIERPGKWLDRERRKLSRRAGGRKGEAKGASFERLRLRLSRRRPFFCTW